MILKDTGKVFDSEQALFEATFLLERYGSGTSQLCLTHRPGASDKLFDGIGSLYDFDTNTTLAREQDFTVFNSDLTHTYLYEIYRSFPNLGRFRIMRIKPVTCYTVHRDNNPRLHLALKTNSKSYFIFPDDGAILQVPVDGHVYWADTTRMHTYINGHRSEERIHLVMDDLSGSR